MNSPIRHFIPNLPAVLHAGGCLAVSLLPVSITASDLVPAAAPTPDAWTSFNDWSLGDVLFPGLHLHGIGGASSVDPALLDSGGHDPNREAFSAQAIEPALSLRTKYLEGFTNYIFFQDAAGDWQNEWEEAFAKIVNLPGGFELKGGQYLPRYGALNDKHLHAWDFVDSETVLSQFLGEHGLLLQGAEASWTLPFNADPVFVSIASLGYGNALAHEHEHHDHGGVEPPHEGDEATLADDIVTARLMGRYRFDDFRSITSGLSWAGGTNGFGRDTQVVSLDAEYLWRERGLEAGGRSLRLRGELLWRDVDAYSEHDEDENGIIDVTAGDEIFSGSYDEAGAYAHAIYTWDNHLDTGLRMGWVEGTEDFGQAGRLRFSPAVTYWFDDDRRIGLRTQYNFDHFSGGDDEHSVWFQLNFALGSTQEVR
ncbi:MAG: hypothetical protein RLZZ522_1632 [Verrucomicrobiota bacterium]